MTAPQQLTAADLARLTPAEIDAARAEGRCAVLLGDPSGGVVDRHDLARMTGPQVAAAQKAGRLDALLGITTPGSTTGTTDSKDTDR